MKKYLVNHFSEKFGAKPELYLSCGGRFEILGNHTDHNHGKCLAGTCSLSIYAAVSKRNDKIVKVFSEGFEPFETILENLEVKHSEFATSSAIIKGIAFYLKQLGHNIGGFDIYIHSEIPSGAGVSSSAAFELLICKVFNALYNEDKIEKIVLCKAGQFAEREYYGKKCGLLDQIGVGFGGSVYIDFSNIENPMVEPLPIETNDYRFLIINSNSSHAGLDDLYKAIPDEMFAVANIFGKQFLNDIAKEDVIANKETIISKLGDRPYLRALHFYSENERVGKARQAIVNKDFDTLMRLMDESCNSSTKLLQNMKVNEIKDSPLEVCRFVKEVGKDDAAVKINGGGFAGSVICLIKERAYQKVLNKAIEKYGKANVFEIAIRPIGPEVL